MANKNVEHFIKTYGPVAVQVSKEINVDPNVLLSQWGSESRWGQSEMAKKHHNLGGIKDFSGHGFEAKDNKTGSVDKYVKFEDPEVFGMYYADQIKKNFPNVINTGDDIGAFTRGLASGKNGSYFEVSPDEYQKSLTSFQAALPTQLPFEPTAQPDATPAQPDGDLKLGDASRSTTTKEKDKSGASAGERFLGGTAGAALGTLAIAKQGSTAKKTANAIKLAGAEEAARENARLAAQRAAASVTPPAPPGVAPGAAPGTPKPPLGSTIMRPGGAPAVGGLPTPMGVADAGRMAQGQTGVIPYNTAKALGVTDIEAGQALTNTKQAGGAWDIATKRAEALNKLQNMGMGNFVENPMYGGIMTEAPSVGGGPRESFTMKPPVAPSPDLPQGQPGGLSQLPPKQVVPTAPPPPPAPSMGMKTKAGLDWITGKFANMIRPVASAAGTVGKYALPPLAGVSAGLDVAEMAHEYDKPKQDRDITKIGLKGLSAASGLASMVPGPHQLVTIPVSLGASAAQAYRDDPEFFNQKMKEYTGYSP